MKFFGTKKSEQEPEEDSFEAKQALRSEIAKEFLLAIITARDESYGEFVNLETVRLTVRTDVQMAVMYADELARELSK